MNKEIEIIELTEETIKDKIYVIRGQKVMLDFELAEIYGYETKRFNEQIKNNIERFDEDFRFKVTKKEFQEFARSKKSTSPIWTDGNKGGRTYLPYAFTEQGIYMLMTVLRGELAAMQSKALIRLFKQMKDYIIESNSLLLNTNSYIESKFASYDKRFEVVENKLEVVMDNFIDKSHFKEFLIYDGERIEADIAYKNIFSLACKTLYLIDDYIGVKTLEILKFCRENVKIIIFSDNVAKPKLSLNFVNDFKSDRPDLDITFKKTNNRVHDRYIAIDIDEDFKLFHSGASPKDGGNKITTIMKIEYPEKYKDLFNELMKNEELIINLKGEDNEK